MLELAVLAAAAICLTTTTAVADDLDPGVDPLIAAVDAFIAELVLDKSDKEWKSKVPVPGATGAFDPDLSHNKKGIVSMANSGLGTDGSQFFITCAPAKRLNGKHTIFGKLAEGKRTLSKLERAGTSRGKPKRKVFIQKATITVE